MAVMAREVWTDERLDDLNHRVDEGFSEMREEFRAVRGEMAASHRSVMHLLIGMIVTMALGFAGLIATLVVQT
jgi:broad specificity phosphatase PhoE